MFFLPSFLPYTSKSNADTSNLEPLSHPPHLGESRQMPVSLPGLPLAAPGGEPIGFCCFDPLA